MGGLRPFCSVRSAITWWLTFAHLYSQLIGAERFQSLAWPVQGQSQDAIFNLLFIKAVKPRFRRSTYGNKTNDVLGEINYIIPNLFFRFIVKDLFVMPRRLLDLIYKFQ